jgi:hypothetical protein
MSDYTEAAERWAYHVTLMLNGTHPQQYHRAAEGIK